MLDGEEATSCRSCRTALSEPYILCLQCSEVRLCLHCFAQGYQSESHKNYHNYDVMRSNFTLFDCAWTANEELKLLNAITEYGYGNWVDVAQAVESRSPVECREHYNKIYIWAAKEPLPQFPDPDINYPPPPIIYKLCDDPPRPSDHSPGHVDLSGYMAARSEFTVEFDQFAEMDVKDVKFTSSLSETDREIREVVMNIYWRKLAERERRKRIIRDYGLISLGQTSVLPNSSSCPVPVRLLAPFSKFLKPVQFDMFIQALIKEAKLKNEVRTLQKLRQNGVTRLTMAKLYHKLAARRREVQNKPRAFGDIYKYAQDQKACYTWLHKSMSTGGKRPISRLDITGLPGFDKLTEAEKEFCSAVRFVPSTYLDHKDALLAEFRRKGRVTLGQARLLVRIDVNKTRKLYDFLVAQDIIREKTDVTILS